MYIVVRVDIVLIYLANYVTMQLLYRIATCEQRQKWLARVLVSWVREEEYESLPIPTFCGRSEGIQVVVLAQQQ